MEFITQISEQYGGGVFLLAIFVLLVGAIAKWRLFAKCDQPGLAAFVPIWDLLVICNIVGRPKSHALLFLIPVFNIYFLFRIVIELVQSFGKNSMFDYILAIVFNVFYILNMALAYNEVYYGPVYGRSLSEIQERKARYAPAS